MLGLPRGALKPARSAGDAYGRYSMILEWEPQGGVYVVTVPEIPGCRTHGETLEEAVRHGREVMEGWVDIMRKDGEPLPAPKYFALKEIEVPA